KSRAYGLPHDLGRSPHPGRSLRTMYVYCRPYICPVYTPLGIYPEGFLNLQLTGVYTGLFMARRLKIRPSIYAIKENHGSATATKAPVRADRGPLPGADLNRSSTSRREDADRGRGGRTLVLLSRYSSQSASPAPRRG